MVPDDINAFGPKIFKHCYPILDEGNSLALQKLFLRTDNLIIVPK